MDEITTSTCYMMHNESTAACAPKKDNLTNSRYTLLNDFSVPFGNRGDDDDDRLGSRDARNIRLRVESG